jgi:hypothetical protein
VSFELGQQRTMRSADASRGAFAVDEEQEAESQVLSSGLNFNGTCPCSLQLKSGHSATGCRLPLWCVCSSLRLP